ncbi:MAG: metallophosphoesterase family protein [Paludibacteraceae bacterium]|nr:metallophosphoesterase family protein [Paludibacteraceae bacterium]MBQ6765110.1 metallophosphoesterase family protein [Paludibacteraceae bacterium]
MTRIGILSDTHGLLDQRVFEHFKDVDEIWHAGDIGGNEVLQRLREFKPTRAVYGNMDSGDVRWTLSEFYRFRVEEVKVLMTHIGGYPGHYNPWLIPMFRKEPPDLFVCGHSHILKVQYDKLFNFLTINPGAAGKQGWQPCQTLVRLTIDGEKIDNLEVIELQRL